MLLIVSVMVAQCWHEHEEKEEEYEEDGGDKHGEDHYDEEDHKGEKGHKGEESYDKGEKGSHGKEEESHHFDEVSYSLIYIYIHFDRIELNSPVDRNTNKKKAATTKKTNMVIITNRRKVQKVANMATKKATKKAPKPLDITTKRTKMNLPKRKSSTIAKIRKATTRNMAASTNSTNRRKANTRKVIIISPISIKDTKAKRDIIRKAITMTITRDTRANMVMISTIPMKNITERKVAKRVAAKKDTNPKDINHHCNRNVSHIFSDM